MDQKTATEHRIEAGVGKISSAGIGNVELRVPKAFLDHALLRLLDLGSIDIDASVSALRQLFRDPQVSTCSTAEFAYPGITVEAHALCVAIERKLARKPCCLLAAVPQ